MRGYAGKIIYHVHKEKQMIRTSFAAGLVCMLLATNVAVAQVGVGVSVSTPNVSVQVGTTPPPPPPRVTVIEKERIVVKDNGKHKGHYKKHKKEQKHHRD